MPEHNAQTTYTVDDVNAVRSRLDAAGYYSKVDGDAITVMYRSSKAGDVRKLVEEPVAEADESSPVVEGDEGASLEPNEGDRVSAGETDVPKKGKRANARS